MTALLVQSGDVLYTGAMDEVDWLKSRLEHLESTIVAQGHGKGESQGRPVSRRGCSAKDLPDGEVPTQV